jgi:STAM-binding protein
MESETATPVLKYFRSYGIFRLTDPAGMEVLRECDESGFHTHPEATDGSPIY